MSTHDGQHGPSPTGSVEQIRSELAGVSVSTVTCGAHTVAFQPSRRPELRIEDRHLVEDWDLADGAWKFIGVFDGHGAGHEAVDFVVETLPGMIKSSLTAAVSADGPLSNSALDVLLVKCISAIDERIIADLMDFFPGGPGQISRLTDDEIKNIIRDPDTGTSYIQVMRARTGTTALVALIDPSKSLHVASLGDCEAALGLRNASGGCEMRILNGYHNASSESEADRVRADHPDEAECILQYRTLGLITLTRALGDVLFKLPAIYTERVLALATPPFHENYRINELLARNLTPPYLSNEAEVKHVDLSSLNPTATPVLIMCSDGLIDLYSRRSRVKNITEAIRPWLISSTHQKSDNLAFDLLWDALGGDDGVEESSTIIRGMSRRRVDDTTVVVLRL